MTCRSTQKCRAPRTGVLPLLAGVLLTSALLRTGGVSVGDWIAPMAEAGRASDAAASETDGIAELLTALQPRQADLDAREESLKKDAARLEEGRSALAKQLSKITAAETELRTLLNMADRAAEDDLTRLATVYENMKPAEAGALFEQMPPAFAAGFLGLMPPAAAARILAEVRPETAFAVSVVMAGRNVDIDDPVEKFTDGGATE